MTAVTAWAASQAEAEISRQRGLIDTYLLVTTFATAIAAGLAATAMEVPGNDRSQGISLIALGGAFALTLGVLFVDRTAIPNLQFLIQLGTQQQWSQTRLVEEFEVATVAAADVNRDVVGVARRISGAQLAVATVSGVFAVFSIL